MEMLEFLILSGEFPGFSNEHEEMNVDFLQICTIL